METATSETINQPLVNGQIDERHTSDTFAADSLSRPSSGIKDTVRLH